MRAPVRMVIRPLAGVIGAALATLLVGCVAPPGDRASFDQAQAAVERARGAPRVRALAAAELDRAEVTLERARVAAVAGAPASHVDHLAYAASRQAALAEAHAADRVAQDEIAALRQVLGRQLTATPAVLPRGRAAGAWGPRAAGAPPPAILDASLPELALELSELTFEGAALGGETASRLDAVADLLIGEPARKLSIEVDLDRPDPAARALVERRIETVRAAFLRRGIEASRIGVRAGVPAEEQAASSFEHFPP